MVVAVSLTLLRTIWLVAAGVREPARLAQCTDRSSPKSRLDEGASVMLKFQEPVYST
jgi:hypothetical protein